MPGINREKGVNHPCGEDPAPDPGSSAVRYYKKDFWSQENLKFTRPHFRLEKSARLINKIAGRRPLELLDIGCGPATLQRLLRGNIAYHGVDIVIHESAPNLIETDFLESPIGFKGKKFDIVVAQGVFEYIGTYQEQKLAEISELLRPGGSFIVSYVNFGHRDRSVYWPYSNIQEMSAFRGSLSGHFRIDRSFPTSHNWNHSEPSRWFMRVPQLPLKVNMPIISPLLAVEYFFVCSPAAVRRRG